MLQVDDEYSDQELIEDIFLKGFCKNVSNVQVLGEDFSVGHFSNGENIIGIDRGIIISSGDIKSASSNNTDTETTTVIGTSGDKDLSRITATASVFDASGISFDFVPLSNRVSFSYVFASEEYCEWVGSAFNDVFGFFVSGPGIEGEFSDEAKNVALLPDTDEFVSINTINHRTNSDLYIKNELQADTRRCGTMFLPQFSESIEYDGFTVPLIAEFDVIPCETYTIRLVVGDVSDELYDSAVFLEMNSFDIGGNLLITASAETSSDTLVSEGCTDGIFTLQREDSNKGFAETFELEVSPSSTAILGSDIEPFPLSIDFLAGETQKEISVKIIDDNITEGQETFSISVAGECPCTDKNSASLLISDGTFFSAEFDEYKACESQIFSIEPIINGGAPPYRYEWSDGSTAEDLTTEIISDKRFDLIVTDYCDRETMANLTVAIKQEPIATISGEYFICTGIENFVEVELEGSAPWELTYQINDEVPITESEIAKSPFMIPASNEGQLKLIEFNDRTCSGVVIGEASIIKEEIEIEIFKTPPSCQNTYDGEIVLDIISNSPAKSINWTPTLNDNYQPTQLQGGNYGLMITDERGCIINEVIELNSTNSGADCDELNIYIPNTYSPNGDGNNDDFIIQIEYEPQIVSVASFSIFDRWGNRVFEKKNFAPTENDIGFDAAFLNKQLFPGVFGYVATFNLFGDVKRSISGTITVIR